MHEHPTLSARIQQRLEELQAAVETLTRDIELWDRDDLPDSITPVPMMVAYGILSQLAADLAILSADHATAHRIMELSERVTAAVRTLHRKLHRSDRR